MSGQYTEPCIFLLLGINKEITRKILKVCAADRGLFTLRIINLYNDGELGNGYFSVFLKKDTRVVYLSDNV